MVARHIEDITGNPVTVDEWSHLYGSLGTVLSIASEQRGENKYNYIIDDLFSAGKSARNYRNLFSSQGTAISPVPWALP